MRNRIHRNHFKFLAILKRDQRGLSLLEVLLSTVILGVALTGFLMALATASSTSRLAIEEDQLVFLASLEFERLREAVFDDVPFLQTDEPDNLEKVPNYFKDIAISEQFDGDVLVVSTGDLSSGIMDYIRDYVFDGKRADFNLRWMGDNNALAYVDTGGGPTVGGPGGGGPSAGGPGGDPGAGGDYAPDDFQYIYCAFPELTEISRILYDNRFNVTEIMGVPLGDFDYLPHVNNIWQRKFDFFWAENVLGTGEIYDPWHHNHTILESVNYESYGSAGIWVIFDNPVEPLEAGIIGVKNIDTYSDFDANFHWPYATEIEAYGFSEATNYVEEFSLEDGEMQYDNVIMYFPDYLDSGFDMGRRIYVEDYPAYDPVSSSKDLIYIVLEFFPTSNSNRNETWQKVTWWDPDNLEELARFQTCFYRDAPTRVDRLPNLEDLPVHKVYDNNEDIEFVYTVPGASELRAYFNEFDLEPGPGTDSVTIEDADGNIYLGPAGGNIFYHIWTPWVTGDTIVIHFQSDGSGNTYDSGYGGFEVSSIEVKWVGVGTTLP